MADVNTRIEQFKKMAGDDPNNELGHFSLGRAYLDAGMDDGAIASFARVLEINANMSRTYQLLALALVRKGQKELAIEQLSKGVRVAQARGDMMPRNEMLKMLEELGESAPDMKPAEPDRPVGAEEVFCARCGRIGARLKSPPFRNEQGKRIQEKICQPCWREWVAMGTKVINELRLPLADPQAQRVFDQHMMEFLNLR
jgi:Fe-S cluster biosynthesis and repair protein YggX